MGIDKKYALLDTDFLFKTHLARNKSGHTLADIVISFEDYEFFCHKMIKEELSRHEIYPDPNPWLETKIKDGVVKLYTDRDIVNELSKIYGAAATNMYLTLLEESCNAFRADFFEKYYGSLNTTDSLSDIDIFLAELKKCDGQVPHKKGLGEKKTYVLIQMMQIFHPDRVYVFCSDDTKARRDIARLPNPINCISVLGVFYKLIRMGYKKSDVKEYYDKLSAFLKNQTEYKVWTLPGHQYVGVPIQQVFEDLYDGKFELLINGDLHYIN